MIDRTSMFRRLTGRILARRTGARFAPNPLERLEERSLLSIAFGNSVGFGSNGNGTQSVDGAAVAIDASGNRYVAGSFYGTLDFGSTQLNSAGGRDGYVAKFAPDGSIAYLRQLGTAADEQLTGLAIDSSGNVYATGSISAATSFGSGLTLAPASGSSVFVWSLDSTGSTRSAALISSSTSGSVQTSSIAVTPTGDSIAVSGSFTGAFTVPGSSLSASALAGAQDGFLLKMSAIGSPTWLTSLDGTAGSQSRIDQVVFDPSGKLVAAETFKGTVDFDPTSFNYSRTSVAGSSDFAVVKYFGSVGTLAGIQVFGGAGLDSATGVAVDRVGNAFVTGVYQQSLTFAPGVSLAARSGGSSFYLLGLKSSGAVAFARDLGTTNSDTTATHLGRPSVVVNTAGVVAVAASYTSPVYAGRFTITPDGGSDLLIETYDPSGRLILATSAGGSGDDLVSGLAINDTGEIAMTGQYAASSIFGDTFLLARSGAAPGQNVFVTSMHSQTPMAADFDGVGHSEPAVFRQTTGEWFVYGPYGRENLGSFGGTNLVNIPVPGDYQAIGHSQLAVFDPSTANWIVNTPAGPQVIAKFGATNLMDIPVPGDYDGVGYTEPAVFRPSTGEWFVLGPYGSHMIGRFGATNLMDIPVPGDFLGLGYAQPAIFRPSTAQWYVKSPSGSMIAGHYGATNLYDIPSPGDFDGNGQTDLTIFRPSTTQWYTLGPNGTHVAATFGNPNLVDVPAAGPVGYIECLFQKARAMQGSTAKSSISGASLMAAASLVTLPPPQVAGTVKPLTPPPVKNASPTTTSTTTSVSLAPRLARPVTVSATVPSRSPLAGFRPRVFD